MPPVFISVPPLIKEIIEAVIAREGGFVDNPADPGGATNMGITFQTLEIWKGGPIDKDDVCQLTKSEAIQIYYHMFWEPLNLHHIKNWWLKEFIFDWCVNAGLKNPVRQIQRIAGVKSDGVIGPVTAAAIDHWMLQNGVKALGLIVDERIRWYIKLVKKRHSLIQFMEGWFNRANSMRYEAYPYSNRNYRRYFHQP